MLWSIKWITPQPLFQNDSLLKQAYTPSFSALMPASLPLGDVGLCIVLSWGSDLGLGTGTAPPCGDTLLSVLEGRGDTAGDSIPGCSVNRFR